MNTANTQTSSNNRPAFEIFYVEERKADKHLAAIMGKTVAANESERIWHKVGVAFVTPKGHLSLMIGPKGDSAQKRYLCFASSSMEKARQNPEATRLPVADLFEMEEGTNIDFQRKAGVAFLNQDESFSLILGDRGDPEQLRYQLRGTTTKPRRGQTYTRQPQTPLDPAPESREETSASKATVVRRRPKVNMADFVAA